MKEKREFARLTVMSQVKYRVKGIFKVANTVLLQNIGASGMMIVTDEMLKEGALLELDINVQDIPNQILAEGQVMWQKKFGEDLFETGIKFTKLNNLDKEILMEYIKNVTGSVGEYRRYIRCPLRTVIKYSLIDDPDIEKSCLSNDISGEGLNVLLKEKVGVGNILKLSFTLPEESVSINAEGEVMWEHEHTEGFMDAGIKFITIEEDDKNRICDYVYFQGSKLQVA